jgi:hypothetical protein
LTDKNKLNKGSTCKAGDGTRKGGWLIDKSGEITRKMQFSLREQALSTKEQVQ